jgi:hypothetical protein
MKIDFQDITLIVVEKNCGIIRMNSAILINLFYTKGVNIKTAADASRTIGYYLLDNFTVEDIFGPDPETKGTSVFKRFTE